MEGYANTLTHQCSKRTKKRETQVTYQSAATCIPQSPVAANAFSLKEAKKDKLIYLHTIYPHSIIYHCLYNSYFHRPQSH